ncbi:MAG: preprotein translocase subunit SecE [Candidatus Melainabacteria bacterium]|nr:preprotein translocase subunit SecE [Candidatus Melainabacteria bacterium]MBI3309525.1 preprotein translocase subunit SecE [Candidatus Melainabacteria bacterium]
MPTQVELGVPSKPEANKGPDGEKTPFNLLEFVKEARTEFSKVTWPSKDQVVNEFISVLILVAVLTGIIFLIDKVFNVIVDFFTGRLF